MGASAPPPSHFYPHMSYKQAIKEAYASADITEIPLDTLELRHSAFRDDNGNPTAVRIVRAFEDWNLTLETDAPVNAGQQVRFVACPFEFNIPKFAQGEVPSMDLQIDNVSREITKHLEEAIDQTDPIAVTYRPYLASDTSGPQMSPPFHFTLSKVIVDVFTAKGTCTMNDVYNWPFPNRRYLPAEFKGLWR